MQLLEELVSELQLTDPVSSGVTHMDNPPYYRITSSYKIPSVTSGENLSMINIIKQNCYQTVTILEFICKYSTEIQHSVSKSKLRYEVCFTRSAVFGVPRVLIREHLIGSQRTALY